MARPKKLVIKPERMDIGQAFGFLPSPRSLTCPRCERLVADSPHGRKAHRSSCVEIPETRNKKTWGKKKVKA